MTLNRKVDFTITCDRPGCGAVIEAGSVDNPSRFAIPDPDGLEVQGIWGSSPAHREHSWQLCQECSDKVIRLQKSLLLFLGIENFELRSELLTTHVNITFCPGRPAKCD